MAVATGAIVANLYYLQPLLHEVQASFGVSSASASALITASQVGYAIGLALVLPLGDLLPRRWLVVAIYLSAGVAMALGAWVHAFGVFAAITLIVGLFSVGGQVMIPFAADLSSEERRGRTVARLMSGLLLGILLSRTVAGIIAQLAGWRSVYVVGAVLMFASAVVLFRALPNEAPRPHVPYPRLVSSAFGLLVELGELRRRAWLGAVCFAGFSVLWTTLAFQLSAPPFSYSQATIGIFGLAGAAGVFAANAAGSLADSNRHRLSTVLASVLLVVSFVIMGLGGGSIVAITIGIVVLDVAVQGIQITNQSIIYALAPQSRSRINSAYMFCYFLGGAAGSLLGGLAYQHGGWRSSSILGVVLGLLALIPAIAWKDPVPAPTLAT